VLRVMTATSVVGMILSHYLKLDRIISYIYQDLTNTMGQAAMSPRILEACILY
jgi:hypothetical protein